MRGLEGQRPVAVDAALRARCCDETDDRDENDR